MDRGLPFGYFSTFSIANPDQSTPEAQSRPQKRKRRVFVSMPCHQRELECDKYQPCTRCIDFGSPSECVYQPPDGAGPNPGVESREFHQPSPQPSLQPSSQASPLLSPHAATISIISKGRDRLNGVIHWSTIASEVRSSPGANPASQ